MAGLVSVYPTPSDPSLASYTVAVSCRPRFSGEWLIHALALGPICQVHRCQIFHGWTEIPTTPIVTHDMHEGDGFAFHIFRQMPIPPQTLDPTDQAPTDVVAHDHAVDESQGPVLLQLNTLIRPAELSSPASDNFSTVSQRPVKLEGLGQLRTQLPSYISVDETQIRDAIKDELQAFGHLCDFALAANNTLAVCFPDGWTPEPDQILILFTDMQQNVPSEDSAFLTMTEQVDWTEIQLMALLHRLGVEKGVVLRTKPFNTNFIEVQFVQPTGTIDDLTAKQRIQRPWPPRNQRSYGNDSPLWQPRDDVQLPRCLLDLGVTTADLHSLLQHDQQSLCTITEGLPLPDVTVAAISELTSNCKFDRLIIYTDGSSQSKHKHVAPALNEELDLPDAWSFIVLGETFQGHDASALSLVGWTAHQVRYDPEHPWHIGAKHVGSAIAERETLTWAMIWRLGLNSKLPTIFRSDSLLTIGQAEGSLGSACCDLSFQTLRGCYQALDAALGTDVALDHVFGHLGDPWNEMADALAKAEARSSFFLSRPNIDIPKIVSKFPFLWMIFDDMHGLPKFTGTGFDLCAPALPPDSPPLRDHADSMPRMKRVELCLSIATANVLSLGVADQGFSGKLDYLRAQFCDLRLNLLGIQEARSAEGMSQKQGVLRLCSGSQQGKWGVELWANLHQPYAYIKKTGLCFHKSDFHVTHRDARRLLVHINTAHLQVWCFVAHAPQSGIALSERQIWWLDTRDILLRYIGTGEQLFLCIDANAAPGVPDGTSVFQEGFRTSSGTKLFRDFLDEFDLCLPITSSLHEGPTTTWTSPDDGEYTIDYVAIPRSWFGACVTSKVISDFDLADIQMDHTAVALELRWTQDKLIPSKGRQDRPTFDRTCIDATVSSELCISADCHWSDDVEQHANRIADHFRLHLSKRFPFNQQRPKKPYISEDLWQLRSKKLFLRNQLRKGRQLLRSESLARIFIAWKSTVSDQIDADDILQLSFAYGTSLRIGCFRRYVQFAVVTTTLRRAVQHNRQQKPQEILQQITPATPASTIQKMLRPFKGPSNKLRQGMAPLPLVQDERGEFCRTAEVALNRWVTFFGQMEGGHRASEDEQWTTWRQHLVHFLQSDICIPVEEVPTLCELEVACRRTAAGKASGLDELPSEVCKFCPRAVAVHSYSLLLKTCAHGQEALSHKGGILLPIWKGKNKSNVPRSDRFSCHPVLAKSCTRPFVLSSWISTNTFSKRSKLAADKGFLSP